MLRGLEVTWTASLRDALLTGVHGYYQIKLAYMARQSVEIMEQTRPQGPPANCCSPAATSP